jgi:UDP-N-acetylglucosamine 2-epimerase (non-hydrolysing)
LHIFEKKHNNNQQTHIMSQNIKSKSLLLFFIGTEAELIKMFPVIYEIKVRKIDFMIISSGQNDISKSRVLQEINQGKIDILLSDYQKINKNPFGLLIWFFKLIFIGKRTVEKAIKQTPGKQSLIIVHGDTISTLLGAIIGKQLGLKIAHIEAGLRSHDLINPFPEEINRVLTSFFADIHFAPGKIALNNLNKIKGIKINTIHNTILDSLTLSQTVPASKTIIKLLEKKYFVFVLHRQENLVNRRSVTKIMDQIIVASKAIHCLFIMHKVTELALKKFNLYDNIIQQNTITCTKRVEYFDFVKLLNASEFVITDGGSNQEELSYMGTPCLILRNKTERFEGIGNNILLFNDDISMIGNFQRNYKKYQSQEVFPDFSPSNVIVDKLEELIK